MSNRVLQNSEKITALYLRLSKEDAKSSKEDPSNSVSNQHALLVDYANKNGFRNIRVFVDDGTSGVTFKREGFNELDELIMNNQISTVIVKDLSRFGRNYIEAGIYLEQIFPTKNIRFIAVNDNEDSNHYSEMVPFRNLFNEWYSRDISKKIKSSFKVKDSQGYALGRPPYGYMRSEKSKIWIVDEEAAENVRLMYRLRLEGKSVCMIGRVLESKGIVSPSIYSFKKYGLRLFTLKKSKHECFWGNNMIVVILKNQVYCGDVVNFKTCRTSFKLRKILQNPKEKQSIHENIHESIVNREDWEKVQRTFESTKLRYTKISKGVIDILLGFLKCSTCGGNLNRNYSMGRNGIVYYSYRCRQFHLKNGLCNGGMHYISKTNLEKMLISDLNDLISIAKANSPDDLFKSLTDNKYKKIEDFHKSNLKKLNDYLARSNQIDTMINKALEKKLLGDLSDDRFDKFSFGLEKEQTDLKIKIGLLQKTLSEKESKKEAIDKFIKILKESLSIEEINRETLNTFIDKIIVYQPERVNGKINQKVEIHYNFVGEINLQKLKKNLPRKVV